MEAIIEKFAKCSTKQILRLDTADALLYASQISKFHQVHDKWLNAEDARRRAFIWIMDKVEPDEPLRQVLGVDAEFWDAKVRLEREAKAAADEPWIRVTELPVVRVVLTVPKSFFEFVGTKVFEEVTFRWVEFHNFPRIAMDVSTVLWASNMTLAGCGNAKNAGIMCDKALLPKLRSALSRAYTAWESVVQVLESNGSLRLEKPPIELKVVEDNSWRVTYHPSLKKPEETVTSVAEVVAFAQTLSGKRTRIVVE
jgi:hypothetical protein